MSQSSDGFRTLRFESLDDMAAEVERLAEADRTGRLRTCGRWTLGQALGHWAGWSDYGYLGYPPQAVPPWFVKMIAGLMRRRFLTGPMRRGVRIPRMEEGTLNYEVLATDEGVRRYREAAARLAAGPPLHPSPVFGAMSQEDAIALNLRHGELHLGHFQC